MGKFLQKRGVAGTLALAGIGLVLLIVWAPAAAAADGCADGVREGFIDELTHPNVAGCSGTWDQPYLRGPRVSAGGIGDDNPGTESNVAAADLCAVGWHICRSAAEVTANSGSGTCTGATSAGDPNLFFVTLQSGPGNTHCGAGNNDLFGCGNYGGTPGASCTPLNRFGNNLNASLGATIWDYVGDNTGTDEAIATVKVDDTLGGVLCCPSTVLPVAVDDEIDVDEDTIDNPIVVLTNDTGLDDGPITVIIGDAPLHGTAVVQPDNSVLYTPDANYAGADSFTYVVTDIDGQTATATVTIDVANLDDVPVAMDDATTASEDDAPFAIDILANDTGAYDLPLGIAFSNLVGCTVTWELDGLAHVTLLANFNGIASFTYELTDGNGDVTSAEVTIDVAAVNDAPVGGADLANTNTDTEVTLDVLANDTDVEDDTLDVIAVTDGSNGTVVINLDGTVTYTPTPGFTGTDTFTYTVSDGQDTDEVTVTVSVGVDTDGDGLTDIDELGLYHTDPFDDDSDDDGLVDGYEIFTSNTDPNDADSDGDGIQDGTELGFTTPQGDDTGTGFVPDADPVTTTDPNNLDTDGGGASDGQEDANGNGRIDDGETDPNDASDDSEAPEPEPEPEPTTPDTDGDGFVDDTQVAGGRGCNTSDGHHAGAIWLCCLALAALAKRRARIIAR